MRVSTPGSSRLPSTSMTRPAGGRVAVGHRVSSVTTICPDSACAAFASGDLNVGQNSTIERHDVAKSGIVDLEAADERAVGTLEDPDDPALGPIAALMFEARDDTIAVERFLDVRRRDVQVALGLLVVRHDEAVAGRMHLQTGRRPRPSDRQGRSDCRGSGAARRRRPAVSAGGGRSSAAREECEATGRVRAPLLDGALAHGSC